MATGFSSMAAFTSASMNLTGAGLPERLEGALATTELFSTLGVHALLGRTFLSTDADGPRPVVLGAALWTRLFGADPNVLGRTVILNETPHVIVGVMPPTFDFPSRTTEFWTPFAFDADAYEDRGNTFLQRRGAPGARADGRRGAGRAAADRRTTRAPVSGRQREDQRDGGAIARRAGLTGATDAACVGGSLVVSAAHRVHEPRPSAASRAPLGVAASWPCASPSAPLPSGWSDSC